MGRSGYSRLLDSVRAFSEAADSDVKLRGLILRADDLCFDDLRFMALCSWPGVHGKEKKDRGCSSINFQVPSALATVKFRRSFLRAMGPPLAGSASISASTAKV